MFGVMFCPKPFEVASEVVRTTRPGGRSVMRNWIPNHPTLVAQILKISITYTPPPSEGFINSMIWGVESNVIERLGAAGVPANKISLHCAPYEPDCRSLRLREALSGQGPNGNACSSVLNVR
jgi:hypothetical protein